MKKKKKTINGFGFVTLL